jgi:hypothetical protein
MPINSKKLELDNIIFCKKSFKEFEKSLNEVLKDEKFDSDYEQKIMYSLYMWLYISHTRDVVKSNIKSVFLKNYWKYLNDLLSKSKRVQSKDKYIQGNEIINEPKLFKKEFENTILNFKVLKDYKLFEADIKKLIFYPNNNLMECLPLM